MTRTVVNIAMGAALALAIAFIALNPTSDSEAVVAFAVNSTLDEVDADIGDGDCATLSGVCTVRAGIQETNALPGMDILDVPAGVYFLTIAGADEDASATGDLDITDDLKVDGASGVAIIDGSSLDRVFDVDPNSNGLDVELYDLRIRNGLTPADQNGGGVLTNGSTTDLHIERSFFDSNEATMNGGGLYNDVTLTMVDVEFIENEAVDGGGLYLAGDTAVMTNVEFYDNEATSDGGGFYGNSVAATLTNGTFDGNWASERGGAVLDAMPIAMTTGTFTQNTAEMGGAWFTTADTTSTITDVTMSHNTADFGGAVYNEDLLAIDSSTLNANFAEIHGGGFVNSGLGILDLRNLTISGNEARMDGGGGANYGDLVAMNNVTITLNTADWDVNGTGDGGGLFNDSPIGVDVVFSNTILARNNFPVDSPDCFGALTSTGYNAIQDTSSCVIGGDTTGNVTGMDPGLITLGNNGGNTQTHSLESTSPALDAANPAAPGTLTYSCETVDQRGVSRPRDGNGDQIARCDIGAFEQLGGPPVPTPIGTPAPTASATVTASPTASATATASPTPSPTASPSPTQTPVQLTWANANCLSDINPVDSLSVLRADAGLSVNQGSPCLDLGELAFFDGIQRIWGDFDCSGNMNPVDALKILQYDSGFAPGQAAGCPSFGDLVAVA